jgi:signal transduction histidine kinase/CheY-like chemotaxis protein
MRIARDGRLWKLGSWTIAYALLGKLGLLLAVPPGYATAIFPPAGIALAAMLVDGPITLPYTFLGSLVLNAWEGYSVDNRLGFDELIIANGIAAASTIQAAAAGAVMRQFLRRPYAFVSARDLVRFVLLCPVCGLVSPTISHAVMFGAGKIGLESLGASWMTWWVGDTLGMLVMVPIVLTWVGEPEQLWRRRRVSVALPMAAAFALFVVIFVRVSAWENDQRLLEYRLQSQRISDRIQEDLNQQAVFLDQLANIFGSSTSPITRAAFRELTERLPANFPYVQAVEWSPKLTAAQRLLFEAQQRENDPNFRISESGLSGEPALASDRPVYFPVTFIEPLTGNEEALGFDLSSVPARREAIDLAFSTNKVAATAPIRLVQERGGQPGLVLIRAVPTSPNGAGVVLIVLRMTDFITRLAPADTGVSVELVDQQAGQSLFNDLETPATAVDVTFAFGGRNYRIISAPTTTYFANHVAWESWAVLVAGILCTALLGTLLMLASGQAFHFEGLLALRTKELEDSHERMRQAQKIEAIGKLTGGVAHDFNNLLMVISGNLELILLRTVDERVRHLAKAAQQGATRAAQLVTALLAFARRQPLRPETVNPNWLIKQFVPVLKGATGDAIELQLILSPTSHPCRIDAALFQSALLNLVKNAADAMPKGGRVTIETQNVEIGHTSEMDLAPGDYVRIVISDTGIGMQPDQVKHAFEPFFTTKEVGQGTGLGLAQVYGFVKQSGGTVELRSEESVGTQVTLYLPRSVETDAVHNKIESKDAAIARRARVLVVEDDSAVRSVLVQLLASFGYDTLEARDGREALMLINASEHVDIVLTDYAMPGGISGAELGRHIATLDRRIKVVLISGNLGADSGAGGAIALQKPITAAALERAIRDALNML